MHVLRLVGSSWFIPLLSSSFTLQVSLTPSCRYSSFAVLSSYEHFHSERTGSGHNGWNWFSPENGGVWGGLLCSPLILERDLKDPFRQAGNVYGDKRSLASLSAPKGAAQHAGRSLHLYACRHLSTITPVLLHLHAASPSSALTQIFSPHFKLTQIKNLWGGVEGWGGGGIDGINILKSYNSLQFFSLFFFMFHAELWSLTCLWKKLQVKRWKQNIICFTSTESVLNLWFLRVWSLPYICFCLCLRLVSAFMGMMGVLSSDVPPSLRNPV